MTKINALLTLCVAGAMSLASTSAYASSRVVVAKNATNDVVVIRTQTPCAKGCDLIVDTTVAADGNVMNVQVVTDYGHSDEAVSKAVEKARSTALGAD